MARTTPAQKPRGQQNQFRIDVGSFETERLGVDLMELAETSRLRPLPPEHRSHAPDAQSTLTQQPVRYRGAHDPGSRFRSQCDLILALIDEAEHFLFDDIGEIAYRALEQLRLLDHRYSKFLVPVGGKDFARDSFQILPRSGLRRQHIVNASQGLDDLAQVGFPLSRVARRYAIERRSPLRTVSRASGPRRPRPRSPRPDPRARRPLRTRSPGPRLLRRPRR